MSMSLVATMHIGSKTFTQSCIEMGVDPPEVNTKEYHAVVTQDLFNQYKNKANEILSRGEIGEITRAQYRFLQQWAVVYNARLDILMGKNVNLNDEWEDLIFQ